MSHTRSPPPRQRVQRSELAVPGSNPQMFDKAAASDADFVFLDLEDAVAPGDKVEARRNVIEALQDIDWQGMGKTVSVRINGLDTHYMYRDVVDVVEQAGQHLDTILIPKAGVAADVYMVDAMVTQIEESMGIEHRIGLEALRLRRLLPGSHHQHRWPQPRLPRRPVARGPLPDARRLPRLRRTRHRRSLR